MAGDLADLEARHVRDALRLLRKAELKVVRILDEGRGSSFDQMVALQRKQAIDREIDALEAELRDRAGKAAVDVARALAPAGRETGIQGLQVAIDVRSIVRAAQTAATQVRGVTEPVRAKVNSAILRGLSGELTLPELDREVRRGFASPVTDARVARIVRTEFGEIFSQQSAARHTQLAASGVDLIKVWKHKLGGRRMYAGDGRPLFREDHVQMHGQERELLEPFDMGGGAGAGSPPGTGQYHPMVPLDPGLPAAQRIHCGCRVVEVARSEAQQPYTAREKPPTVLDKLAAPPEAVAADE